MEILNLSGNEISQIDNESFEEYEELINLSLSRNSIHSIELFAFIALKKLSYLDLSDNRIEQFDNRIVEHNEKLTFVDLSKNKFMTLDDSPILISKSLEFFSLRNSHLSHIYDSFFRNLTSLIDLDLSNNLLITLKETSLEMLNILQFINLEYNRFSCDQNIENTLQYLKKMNVRVKIDKCAGVKNSKKPMFEKMIMHSDYTTPAREDVEIELLWGHSGVINKSSKSTKNEHKNMLLKEYYASIKIEQQEETIEINCENDEFFPQLCECKNKFISLYESSVESLKIQKKSIETRIIVLFCVGILFGIILGYCITFLINKCCKLCKRQAFRQKMRERFVTEMTQPVMTQTSPRNRDSSLVIARSPVPTPRHQPRVNQPNSRVTIPEQQLLTPLHSSEEVRFEISPTAQLMHRLFRNRDTSSYSASPLVERRSEIVPIVINRSSTVAARSPLIEPAETIEEEDNNSEYLSIDNISLDIDLNRSSTPPPPYRDIFNQ